MTEPSPKYGLYLRNITKLMQAPDAEVLGVMEECLEYAGGTDDEQNYMDLLMTATTAAQVADSRGLDWRAAAREHARASDLSLESVEAWISTVGGA